MLHNINHAKTNRRTRRATKMKMKRRLKPRTMKRRQQPKVRCTPDDLQQLWRVLDNG
jgi:hypothetical protein